MSGFSTKYDVRVLQEQINILNATTRDHEAQLESVRKAYAQHDNQLFILRAPPSPQWKRELGTDDMKVAFRVLNEELRTLKQLVKDMKPPASPEKRVREEDTMVPPPVVKQKIEKHPVQSPIRGDLTRIASEQIKRTCTTYSCVCDTGPINCKFYAPPADPYRLHMPPSMPNKDSKVRKSISWKCGHCLKPSGEDHRVCVMEHFDCDVKKWEDAWIVGHEE
jgi:hypothetical protein